MKGFQIGVVGLPVKGGRIVFFLCKVAGVVVNFLKLLGEIHGTWC